MPSAHSIQSNRMGVKCVRVFECVRVDVCVGSKTIAKMHVSGCDNKLRQTLSLPA